MAADSRPSKTLALAPLEPSGGGAAAHDGAAAANDRYMAEATRELDEGVINQRLWVRIVANAGTDKEAAKSAYLRARATELRLAARGELPQVGGNPRVFPGADVVDDAPASRPAERARKPAVAAPGPRRRGSKAMMYVGAGAAVLVAIVVVALMLTRRSADDTATRAAMVATAQPTPASKAKAAVDNAPRDRPVEQSLESKVQELRDAGNWNVLVLYASEWTRKEPTNAAAWRQLSVGYASLRQFDEAIQAATKATQIAPHDPALWRNLGLVDAAAKDEIGAIGAFEHAVAIDENDLYSLVQIGVLNAQIDRLPQARGALDKALAASPQNVDALCAQASVASKQGRQKDADALVRQVSALDAKCQAATEEASTAVAVRRPAAPPPSPAAAARRR